MPKADDKPAEATDTAVKEVEEQVEETDDVELEDIEVTEEELGLDDDEETEEESEEQSEEETEDEEEVEDSEEESDESNDSEEEQEESDDTESEEDTTFDGHKAFKEREQKRLEAEAKLKEQKVAAQQEYLDEAEDDKDLAFRQLQIDAYNNKVEVNVGKLETGINRAIADIPLFNKGTPEQKDALVKRLYDFERMYVSYDKNGDPVSVDGDVYQFLKQEADTILKLSGVGARQEKRADANARSRTMGPPSKQPPKPKVDEDIDDFDTEINRI